MQETINKIIDLVAVLRALPPITADNKKELDEKFRLEFNYNSNHIEGNTLTYGQTQLLLIFDKTEGVHELRELEEMKAHDAAYTMIQAWAQDTEHPLTEAYIKQLNQLILVRDFWKEAITLSGQPTQRLIKVGEYKEYPNLVRLPNGNLFEYSSPIDTPIKMGELIQWFNEACDKQEWHPVVLAALLHYHIVCIHPFDDGNGRIARLLMNYVLLKNNLPPVIIKTKDKKNYLHALNLADTGNIDAFKQYIAEQLIWSIDMQIKATKGERIKEIDDIDKEIQLIQKQLKQQNDATKKLTMQLFIETLTQNIVQIIKLIEEKLSPLHEFFFDRKKFIYYKLDGNDVNTRIDLNPEESTDISQPWLVEMKMFHKRVKYFKYEYHLNGLKKTAQGQSYLISFEVQFNEYNFSITNPQNTNAQPINYPYSITQNSDVLETIANNLIKHVVEDLKRKTHE
ncbi:MAG: Fic family protein [Phycisphaerales bacterium]|nr:Fic family protein [Phycisphaerales bacterium]